MARRDLDPLLVEIQRRQLLCPPGRRLEQLRADLNELASAKDRVALETLLLSGVEAMNVDGAWSSRNDRRAVAVAGVLGLLLLVLIAIFIPDPTPFQYLVFRLVIALSGAAAAAFLPGEFGISASGWGLVVRASSALGVFVLLYWLNPPMLLQRL